MSENNRPNLSHSKQEKDVTLHVTPDEREVIIMALQLVIKTAKNNKKPDNIVISGVEKFIKKIRDCKQPQNQTKK